MNEKLEWYSYVREYELTEIRDSVEGRFFKHHCRLSDPHPTVNRIKDTWVSSIPQPTFWSVSHCEPYQGYVGLFNPTADFLIRIPLWTISRIRGSLQPHSRLSDPHPTVNRIKDTWVSSTPQPDILFHIRVRRRLHFPVKDTCVVYLTQFYCNCQRLVQIDDFNYHLSNKKFIVILLINWKNILSTKYILFYLGFNVSIINKRKSIVMKTSGIFHEHNCKFD